MASRSKKSLTQNQKTFVTKAYQAASLAGLSGVQADLAVSQAIHESAWGTRPSGTNNYHGIKGKGSKVKTHEIKGGRRKNITASFRNFNSMADSFKAWADVVGKKFSGVISATNLKDAVKALRAGKPGGYATDPQYNQKITSTASRIANVAAGPWGAGPARAYAQAQYQRAMPSGPTPPATAPVPSSRPLDSLGGLGKAYQNGGFRESCSFLTSRHSRGRLRKPAFPGVCPSAVPFRRGYHPGRCPYAGAAPVAADGGGQRSSRPCPCSQIAIACLGRKPSTVTAKAQHAGGIRPSGWTVAAVQAKRASGSGPDGHRSGQDVRLCRVNQIAGPGSAGQQGTCNTCSFACPSGAELRAT